MENNDIDRLLACAESEMHKMAEKFQALPSTRHVKELQRQCHILIIRITACDDEKVQGIYEEILALHARLTGIYEDETHITTPQ